MCELSQVSSCVTVVLSDGYSCAQDLSGEPWCPVMVLLLAASHQRRSRQ